MVRGAAANPKKTSIMLLIIAIQVVTLGPPSRADGRRTIQNGPIAFTAANPLSEPVDSDLFTVGPTGAGLKQLTSGPDKDSAPDWSPDGSIVAFERGVGAATRNPSTGRQQWATTPTDIWVLGPKGLANVTNNQEGWDWAPDWSPDGRRIVFVSNREPSAIGEEDSYDPDIYLMNADGSDQRPLVLGAGYQVEPSWSPDGSRIVYADTSVGEIRAVTPDGTHNSLIAEANFAASYPDWGPNNIIAFTKAGDIWVVRPDGSALKNLTRSDANEFGPAWSPDGKRIVFISDRDGGNRLFTMKADGSNVVQLIDIDLGTATISAPSWAPR